MPANAGSQADIVASHSSTGPVRLYIRKGFRPVHVTSQLLLSKDLLDVQFSPDDNGDFTISGLPEPVSVFTAEGYPDPIDRLPSISYSQPTTSRY